jgi:hypothetical protein
VQAENGKNQIEDLGIRINHIHRIANPQKSKESFRHIAFSATLIYSHPPPKYWDQFHIFNQNWTSVKLVMMFLGDKLRKQREQNQMA